MCKQEKNDSVIINLVLSLALATTPLVANFLSVPVLAESQSDILNSPLKQTIENKSKVRIDGSISLATINQSLKNNFEQKFSDIQVEIGTSGSDAALKALKDGKIDIAALSRELSPEEKSQGLEQISLRTEKIAIIVGANNPFQGSLTSKQLVQIFQGEITDWSELGGKSGQIRFIDYPVNSEIRNSFRNSPILQSLQISSGTNITQIPENKTAQIIKKLNTDGLSYARANQVSNFSSGVRILEIEGLAIDNPQYPFSQPLVYVYKPNSSPAVTNFLNFTQGQAGKKVIEVAREIEASAIAAIALQNVNSATVINSQSQQQSVDTRTITKTLPPTNNVGNQQLINLNLFEDRNVALLIVLSLLPIVGLAAFFTWWLKRKKQSGDATKTSLETSNSRALITETISIQPHEYDINPPSNTTTVTNGSSSPHENTTLIKSNFDKDPNLTENKTSDNNLTDDNLTLVAIQPINTDAEVVSNLDINDKIITEDSGEVIWDTEAPVAVVNTSYPSVANIPEIAFDDLELPTDELTTSLLDLLDEKANLSPQDSTLSLSDLLDQKTNSSTQDSTLSVSDLLDEKTNSSEEDSSISVSETLGVVTNSANADSNSSLSELLGMISNSSDAESNSSLLKSTTNFTANSDLESNVSLSELLDLVPEEKELELQPETEPAKNSVSDLSNQLAEAFNNIELGEIFNTLADEAEQKSDVVADSSLDLPIQSHLSEAKINHTLLEVDPKIEKIASNDSISPYSTSESNIHNYTTKTPIWLDMRGESSIVFTPRTPKWAYVSWYVSENEKEAAQAKGGTILAVRLYDATDIDLSYQIPPLVEQYECEEIICDSYVAIPISNRDYMAEIGYMTNNHTWLCLARSSKVRIFNRPGTEFWFVADTELIIHGSTEPGATVTMAGHRIKLQSDGTFNVRIPFSDSLLSYFMTATTSDGENSITILKKFFQES